MGIPGIDYNSLITAYKNNDTKYVTKIFDEILGEKGGKRLLDSFYYSTEIGHNNSLDLLIKDLEKISKGVKDE